MTVSVSAKAAAAHFEFTMTAVGAVGAVRKSWANWNAGGGGGGELVVRNSIILPAALLP